MNASKRIGSFKEFWPYYLAEHSDPRTRKFHVVGTVLGFLFFFYCWVDRRPLWYPLAPLFGYAFGWFGHWKYMGNRPTTLHYPLWSLISDLKMTGLILLRRL